MLNISGFIRSAIFAPAFLGLFVANTAGAQEWPQRAVRFILPFGPASATDLAARLISDELSHAGVSRLSLRTGLVATI